MPWKHKVKIDFKVETKQNKMIPKKKREIFISQDLKLTICTKPKNLGKFISIKTYLISVP